MGWLGSNSADEETEGVGGAEATVFAVPLLFLGAFLLGVERDGVEDLYGGERGSPDGDAEDGEA